MTRRITWIILLTVWATLIAADLIAYFTTRAQMLQHLDHALMDQIMAPRVEKYREHQYQILGSRHGGDRTHIRAGSTEGEPHAQLISAKWLDLPDEPFRHRSITARVFAQPVDGGDPTWITLTYSRPAYEFDPLMNRLAIALVLATLLGGLIAAALARWIANTSLTPLRSTAEVIGTIDDRSLDRRIDPAKLPSELVPMAQKLNGMLERLDNATQLRRRFLADASHELRTPVAALMTAVELALRRPRDSAAYRETLETALADVRHLRRLVEGLMAQVKGEKVSDQDNWETIAPRALLGECVAIVSPLAEERGITILQKIDFDDPLRTQPTRLRTVLLNLLANAIEYSRQDGTIELVAQRVADSTAEICVRDDGPGIDPKHLPHVFEPFFRGDEARQASEHLGLGLFLVKTHTRALGGECIVESTLGAGTTFRIRLPIPRWKPAQEPAKSARTVKI